MPETRVFALRWISVPVHDWPPAKHPTTQAKVKEQHVLEELRALTASRQLAISKGSKGSRKSEGEVLWPHQ